MHPKTLIFFNLTISDYALGNDHKSDLGKGTSSTQKCRMVGQYGTVPRKFFYFETIPDAPCMEYLSRFESNSW